MNERRQRPPQRRNPRANAGISIALDGGMRVFLAVVMLSGCVKPLTADEEAAEQRCTVADVKTDGSIGGRFNVVSQTLAYSRPNADGNFRPYLSTGGVETPLGNPAWSSGHQFVVDWHPAGDYLFVEVEKPTHPGSSTDAIPGYGAYTDLWLVSSDGSQTWKLVDEPNDYDHALTHGTSSPDGKRFTWTERVKAPVALDASLFAGSYVFHIADLVLTPSPHLENIGTYQPGGADQGGEVDGFAVDDATIAFYSTMASKSLLASRIYTWNVVTNAMRELTTDSFAQAPRYTPAGDRLVYMTGSEADIFPGQIQGADWWSVATDGTGARRLTFMNRWNATQSVNQYRLAGVLSFDSPTSFYGDVMTQPLGLTGKIVKVTCKEF